MKKRLFSEFTGGWLVGDFQPNLFQSPDVEIGLKYIKKGFIDSAHYHKKSNEYNLLVDGELDQNNSIIKKGEIFIFEPYDIAEIKALKDSIILVIRDGSGLKDKFFKNE